MNVIIGANRGIGLAIAEHWHARGDQVLATCRTPSPALTSLGVEVVSGVDVTSDPSIAGLRKAVGERSIDLLVIGAGILNRDGLETLDLASVQDQLEVNAVGPLRVATALRDRLPPGAKLAILTSRMGSIADNTSGGYYGYRMSKAAVNMAAVSLAHDLRRDQVAVTLFHPGYVRTDMTGGAGHIDTDESAATMIAMLDKVTMNESGKFYHQNGEELPW